MDSLSDLVHRRNFLAISVWRQLFPYELSLRLVYLILQVPTPETWYNELLKASPWPENMPGHEKGLLEPLTHLLPTTTTTTTNNNTLSLRQTDPPLVAQRKATLFGDASPDLTQPPSSQGTCDSPRLPPSPRPPRAGAGFSAPALPHGTYSRNQTLKPW